MATTSRGSSTTQTMPASRRSSAQMPHNSPSATFQQRRQNEMRSFTSLMARASRRASSLGSFSRWKAMRWADLGPTPGSRPSSSISSWTGAAYTEAVASGRQPEAAEVEPTQRVASGGLRGLLHLRHGVVNCGEHEVFEHRHVVGVDHFGGDGDRLHLHAAGDSHLHHAAARSALDHQLGGFRLRVEELLLHGLRLLEQAAHVELLAHDDSTSSAPGKASFSRSSTEVTAGPSATSPGSNASISSGSSGGAAPST